MNNAFKLLIPNSLFLIPYSKFMILGIFGAGDRNANDLAAAVFY
jgi:hypothetical protein